jgi:biopolymer transport protein ExbB
LSGNKEHDVWDITQPLGSLAQGGLLSILIKGGIVMIPLLASSLISMAVILERLHFWWRLRRRESNIALFEELVAEGQFDQALKMPHTAQHPIVRVLQAGLEYRHMSPGTAMEAASQVELHHVAAYLPILDTIITLAPLLGLLGTITGMINAFGIVSEAGLGQPNAITGGIAEALIATATGLFIAIMTLIPYNYFRSRAERLATQIEEQATRLELLLSK